MLSGDGTASRVWCLDRTHSRPLMIGVCVAHSHAGSVTSLASGSAWPHDCGCPESQLDALVQLSYRSSRQSLPRVLYKPTPHPDIHHHLPIFSMLATLALLSTLALAAAQDCPPPSSTTTPPPAATGTVLHPNGDAKKCLDVQGANSGTATAPPRRRGPSSAARARSSSRRTAPTSASTPARVSHPETELTRPRQRRRHEDLDVH
jgi:hypothetical protein